MTMTIALLLVLIPLPAAVVWCCELMNTGRVRNAVPMAQAAE